MPEQEIINQDQTPEPVLLPKESRLSLLKQRLLARLNFLENLPPKSKKIILIAGVIFLILIILVFVLAVINSRRESGRMITPTPTPSSFTPLNGEITNPSRYATDEAVLAIEADLKVYEERLGKEKIKEEDLNMPQLDFTISF